MVDEGSFDGQLINYWRAMDVIRSKLLSSLSARAAFVSVIRYFEKDTVDRGTSEVWTVTSYIMYFLSSRRPSLRDSVAVNSVRIFQKDTLTDESIESIYRSCWKDSSYEITGKDHR